MFKCWSDVYIAIRATEDRALSYRLYHRLHEPYMLIESLEEIENIDFV